MYLRPIDFFHSEGTESNKGTEFIETMHIAQPSAQKEDIRWDT